jgi:predicted SAM-dependent methyltransferase
MSNKINIGCGKRNFGPTWYHVDGADFKHIHSSDIKCAEFPNDSTELIYSSHTLEYFDRAECLEVLKSWYRILEEGGELYLSVPDFAKMSFLYTNMGVPLHRFVGPLYGKMPMGDKTIYHKTVFDLQSLSELLSMAGFKCIEEYDNDELFWLSGKDDHSFAEINGKRISLNLKCHK